VLKQNSLERKSFRLVSIWVDGWCWNNVA